MRFQYGPREEEKESCSMKFTSRIIASSDNSNAICLPQIIMDAMSLKPGDPIAVEAVDPGEIIIRKQDVSSCQSIRELCQEYEVERPDEMNTFGMVGRELI